MNKLLTIHLVMDYAPGDLAWAEVTERVAYYAPTGISLIPSSVPSFDTLTCGFIVGQLAAFCPKDLKKVIFANCAPRLDNSAARNKNEGEKLVLGVTDGGVIIVAVNSGHSLSFVKNSLLQLIEIPPEEYSGSQFRSRDFFPQILGSVLTNGIRRLGIQVGLDDIPSVPQRVVAHTDSFGNIKTTCRASSVIDNLLPGTRLAVTINQYTHFAIFAYGSFGVEQGQLAFAPGSSGGGDAFLELFLRGAKAAELFNNPKSGTPVEIQLAD